MQYVVRIIEYDEEPDFKSFCDLRDAQRQHHRAALRALEDDLQSAALFRVETDDARVAVQAVQAGNSKLATLIDLIEDSVTAVRKLDLDVQL